MTKSRKVCQLIGCGGPALCMAYLAAGPRNTHLGQAGALLTMALGSLGWQVRCIDMNVRVDSHSALSQVFMFVLRAD